MSSSNLRLKVPAAATASALLFSLILLSEPASAARIAPETLAAWNQQVQSLRSDVERDAEDPKCFIRNEGAVIRAIPGAALQVDSAQPSGRPVPSGLIHHWTGTALLPYVHSSDVLSVLQDYDRYAEIFRPATVESRLTDHAGDTYSYRLKFIQKAMGMKSGLIGEFQSTYVRIDDRSGYSITEATALTELQNPGESSERALLPAQSHGFLERSFTVMRYREEDRGVIIQIESITLSRDVPGSLRWLVMPFIHRFARQTMTSTLESIQARVTAPDTMISSMYKPHHSSR